MIQAPQQRRDGDVEHRKLFTEHVLVLHEDRCELRQAVANRGAGALVILLGSLALLVLEHVHVGEQFLFEIEQEQAGACTLHRVGRHQLRVREALVDIFVDDVRFVQDQVTFDEDRHLAVRVHHRNIFRLIEQVNVADFEIHALFEQDKAATLGKRASRTRIQHHHG
ncbi:hypothetical protein D3C85_1077920 [compost metagenome]